MDEPLKAGREPEEPKTPATGSGGGGGGSEGRKRGRSDEIDDDYYANIPSGRTYRSDNRRPGGGGGGYDSNKRQRPAITNTEATVFVGNLSFSTNWQSLKDHMRQAGEVTYADVLMKGPGGRSKGCGIVSFSSKDEAQKAIRDLSQTTLDGREIYVSQYTRKEDDDGGDRGGDRDRDRDRDRGQYNSRESSRPYSDPRATSNNANKIYIGNLSWNATWQDLKDHFRSCGEIKHAGIVKGHDGRSKGFGIVEFTDGRDVQDAIRRFNDTEFQGRVIYVKEDRGDSYNKEGARRNDDRDRDRGGRGSDPPGARSGGYSDRGDRGDRGGGQRYDNSHVDSSRKVYVGNLAFATTWWKLKDHMRLAGNVDKADIIKGADGRSKGCGLVIYQDAHGAERAIKNLHDSELDGRKIFVREDRE